MGNTCRQAEDRVGKPGFSHSEGGMPERCEPEKGGGGGNGEVLTPFHSLLGWGRMRDSHQLQTIPMLEDGCHPIPLRLVDLSIPNDASRPGCGFQSSADHQEGTTK